MAAYDTPHLSLATERMARGGTEQTDGLELTGAISVLDAMVDQLAERIVQRLAVATQQSPCGVGSADDEWFDSLHAADYLGMHRDTLRKLAAERAIPVEQDGPNCKLYFRRADLDVWRRASGRPRHTAAMLPRVA
jgi:excisionase family DNA binding protein